MNERCIIYSEGRKRVADKWAIICIFMGKIHLVHKSHIFTAHKKYNWIYNIQFIQSIVSFAHSNLLITHFPFWVRTSKHLCRFTAEMGYQSNVNSAQLISETHRDWARSQAPSHTHGAKHHSARHRFSSPSSFVSVTGKKVGDAQWKTGCVCGCGTPRT